jgi:formiminotetrahydrofolate cyclodeaminase
MQDETIAGWLDTLASSAPAPGGGAAAALETAIAAALVEMVCNLTIGKPAHGEHEATMLTVRDRARALRGRAVALAEEDASAFRAVIEAYRLPKATEAEAAERGKRIQGALAGAAEVPRLTALAAAELVVLAASIRAGANPNVVSDVAAAGAAARAALESALVNIEINRAAITDPELEAALGEAIAEIERAIDDAGALVGAVREQLSA